MTRITNPMNERFNALVTKTLEKWHVPGMNIGIVSGGHTYLQSYGFARLPDKEMRVDTLMFVASLTKAFAAGMCSLIVDDTADDPVPIKWDSPVVSKMRDEFVMPSAYATAHTTIEDVLSHRSGMPRHDLSIGNDSWTHVDDVRNLRNLPLTAEPRSVFQYSNIMYHALGRYIEKVTQSKLQTVLTERIWSPLHMRATFMERADAEKAVQAGIASRIATGYAWDKTHREFVAYADTDFVELSAAGSVLSNVVDFTKWLSCLINQSYPLSSRGHAELKTPRIHLANTSREPFNGPQLYALGLRQSFYSGYEIYWHGGDVTGYGSHLCFIPALEWGVIMMANAQSNANYAEQILAFTLIDDLLDIPEGERYDWTKHFENNILKQGYEKSLITAKDRLYPGKLERHLETTLPLENYTGCYFNKGYRKIILNLSSSRPRTLRAECLDRRWAFILDFTHVNGDFFLAYSRQPKDRPDRDWFLFEDFAMKAQFRLDWRGVVVELGLGLEREMCNELVWFRKI